MVFGCITNEGYVNRPNEVEEYCIFNRNQNACNYGVAMGSLAFLTCLGFLALDAYFPQISGVKDRKKAVLADVGISGETSVSLGFMFRGGISKLYVRVILNSCVMWIKCYYTQYPDFPNFLLNYDVT